MNPFLFIINSWTQLWWCYNIPQYIRITNYHDDLIFDFVIWDAPQYRIASISSMFFSNVVMLSEGWWKWTSDGGEKQKNLKKLFHLYVWNTWNLLKRVSTQPPDDNCASDSPVLLLSIVWIIRHFIIRISF